ncbi:MAG TPA: hypothetical protein VE197_02150 [Mycobacterium sp.]|nr:hypothetical protein [Mycobacterium sp.]
MAEDASSGRLRAGGDRLGLGAAAHDGITSRGLAGTRQTTWAKHRSGDDARHSDKDRQPQHHPVATA